MKTHLRFPAALLLLFILLNGCHKEKVQPFVIPVGFHTTVSVLAGSGLQGDKDGSDTSATFNSIWAIAMDAAGNTYVTDNGSARIRKITAQGVVTTLDDNPNASGSMVFANADGLVIDAAGNFYVSYGANNCIRKITPDGKSGVIFAGSPNGEGGDADGSGTAALFEVPVGLAIDEAGNLFVADAGNGKIRKINSAGVVTTVAGMGGFGSADGPAAQASFYEPYGVALDKSGNIYVADGYNFAIRKITPDGVVSTIAGGGLSGVNSGPGGQAPLFYVPTGVVAAPDGTLYVTIYGNASVVKISPKGTISTVGYDIRYYGFSAPTDLVIDKSGTLYIANSGTNQVLKIIPQSAQYSF